MDPAAGLKTGGLELLYFHTCLKLAASACSDLTRLPGAKHGALTLTHRFVRWKMTIEGIPVAQAATAAFEDALAEAISSETGDYTADNSTVMVRYEEWMSL